MCARLPSREVARLLTQSAPLRYLRECGMLKVAEMMFSVNSRFGFAARILEIDAGASAADRLMRRRMSSLDLAPAAAWPGDCAAIGCRDPESTPCSPSSSAALVGFCFSIEGRVSLSLWSFPQTPHEDVNGRTGGDGGGFRW